MLLVILSALLVSYVFVLNLSGDEEAVNGDDGQSIDISRFTAEDVKAIEYNTEEGNLSLILEGGQWLLSDDREFPVNQSTVTSMINGLVSLESDRSIDSSDLSAFGLDEPSLTVKVTLASGEITYNVGAKNSVTSKTYIMTDEGVYTFKDSLSTLFDHSRDDLMYIEDKLPAEITEDSVLSVSCLNVNGSISELDADEIDVSAALTKLKKTLTFKNPVAYGLDGTELASLGFNEDSPKIVIKYSVNNTAETGKSAEAVLTASFTVRFAESAEGKCYYAIDGSAMCFEADLTSVEEIIDILSTKKANENTSAE